MLALALALGLVGVVAGCSGSTETGDDDEASSGGASSGEASPSSSSSSSSASSSSSSGSSSGDPAPTTLRGKVQRLANQRCTGCHGGTDPEALLDLTDVGNTINADSFEMPGEILVVPGDPDASVLVQCIEGDPPGSLGRMPAKAKALTKDETDLVRQWVAEGAE